MMSNLKAGDIIPSWREFIEIVESGRPFFFHGDLTTPMVVKGWQLSTILRYCEKKDGTLRYAVKK